MDPRRWAHLATIGERVLELDGEERSRFVASQLEAEPWLEGDLERFLRSLEDSEEFASGLLEQFSNLLDRPPLNCGEVLGAYTIERPLGSGGMGTVYLARRSDDQYEKTVALKMLTTTLSTDADRNRFLEERQILAGLEHPAIARLIDGGVATNDQPYYVLEYVDGEVADIYADRVDWRAALELVLAVCDAVAHAHTRLVVHCDLKPSNILVTADGNVKLLDFGIARMLETSGDTSPPLTSGTPLTRNYAAPELLRGAAVDTRTDVYSLGVLLYRLLAGVAPYHLASGTSEEMSRQLLAIPFPSLGRSRKMDDVPQLVVQELDTIIRRAVHLDPIQRTDSAKAFADQIRRVQANLPLDSPPPGVGFYRLRKAVRRNPVAAVLSAATVALAIAALGTLIVALWMTRAEARRAEAATLRAVREGETATEVVEFLVSVFDASDPELRQAGASQVTARELLEAGLARIDGAEISDPAVAARLDLTLGRVARKIGEFESARMLLTRAVQRQNDPSVQRQARLELGLAQGEGGLETEGLATLSQAAEDCSAVGDNRCVVEALRGRGSVEVALGDIDGARTSLNEALAIAESLANPTRHDLGQIAWMTYGLAFAEHKGGDQEEAGRLFVRSQELFHRLEGQPTLEAATSYLTLAAFRNAEQDYEAARPLLEQARTMFVDLYGPRHLRVAYVDFLAANVYRELNELQRAREAAERSLEVRRQVLGESHLDTGRTWGVLARVLEQIGEDGEALDAARNSRSITRTGSPMSHANLGPLVCDLEIRLGYFESALNTASETLAQFENRFGPDHVMTIAGHTALARALAANGDLDAALASQRHAVAIANTLRADHPRRAVALVDLGELQLNGGQSDAGRETLRAAMTLLESVSPPQPQLEVRAHKLLNGTG
ncbi:MAG: tetratricopeptide repeat protein [Thermoanaerobaculia bacterium]|nr:tetratricopeptide repeat protein [Thermoanaerobaculia bacterium]